MSSQQADANQGYSEWNPSSNGNQSFTSKSECYQTASEPHERQRLYLQVSNQSPSVHQIINLVFISVHTSM